MAILSKGKTFSGTEQILTATVHQLVDAATFDDPADESTIELHTDGKLRVKGGGIGTAQVADDAITPAKVDEDNDTYFTVKKIKATNNYEVPYENEDVSSTLAINCDNGNFQLIDLVGDVTSVTISRLVAGASYTFVINNTGAYSITGYSSSFKFIGGDDVTNTSGDGAVDVISAISYDGTTLLATISKGFA